MMGSGKPPNVVVSADKSGPGIHSTPGGGLNRLRSTPVDPRLDESACELISYSEQVIIGEMRDMAPGIPNQDEVMQ